MMHVKNYFFTKIYLIILFILISLLNYLKWLHFKKALGINRP